MYLSAINLELFFRGARIMHIPLSFIIFHVGNMNTLRQTWWRVTPCVHFIVLFILVSVAGCEAAQLTLKLLSSVSDKIRSRFVSGIFRDRCHDTDITANIIEFPVSEQIYYINLSFPFYGGKCIIYDSYKWKN